MRVRLYARDTSKKIRSVKKNMAHNGDFGGSFAPYGYRRNPENKHHLLIDPETAHVVKRIKELNQKRAELQLEVEKEQMIEIFTMRVK